MHHMMLDHFADRSSPVHRLDPVAKAVAALAAVLATVLLGRDRFLPFAPLAAALALYHVLGRVPVSYTLKRLLIVSPLALAMAGLFPFFEPGPIALTIPLGPWRLAVSEPGLVRAGSLLAKFLLCFWATILLLSTTRFQDIVQALARLHVPRVFTVQLGFLYRYLWVLVDEMMRMRRAREARDGGLASWPVQFRSHAGLVGVLFLRTYDRAERIYWAMAARGFDGTLHAVAHGRMGPKDWVFLAGVVLGCAATVAADRWVHG
jgi:cobalt/nickel transport system permease protein